MSIRTIVEINHDYAHEIERDPESAVRALMDAILDRGRTRKEAQADARRLGVRVLAARHHSDGIELRINGSVIHAEPRSPAR